MKNQKISNRPFALAFSISWFLLAMLGCDSAKTTLQKSKTEASSTQALSSKTSDPPKTPLPQNNEFLKDVPAMKVSVRQFIMAAQQGDLAIVQRAIGQGIDVNLKDEEERTALMIAAFYGRTSVAEALVKASAKVDLTDVNGRTALMFAASGPNASTVEVLLKAGAQVNARDGVEQFTPLMFAAAEGHEAVVKVLRDCGAALDLRDIDGDGALKFAADRGHRHIVELLNSKIIKANRF